MPPETAVRKRRKTYTLEEERMFLESMNVRVDAAYGEAAKADEPSQRRMLQMNARALSDTRDKIEQNIAAGAEQEEAAASPKPKSTRKKKGEGQ